MKKVFICPFCKKEQNKAIQVQDTLSYYEFDLKTGDSEAVDTKDGEHLDWLCPECGKELPIEVCEKIEKMLGWH
ncbi:MAG: hypothetical protein ACTSR2_00790 [Candidatus Hodarchaeales archaeon]